MPQINIVVVGGGFAGVSAAKLLSKKLKKNDQVAITLIDRHPYHTYMTELHEVAGGRVEPDAIQYDLQRLFSRRKNVQLITDNVTKLNHEDKTVITENGQYKYDYLVLGMGGEANDFGTPGVKENGFTLWSWEDAVRIRRHIEDTVALAARERDLEKRAAMLRFVVCGSGLTGIEMIGELVDWKPVLAEKYHIDASEIELIVVEALPEILSTIPKVSSSKVEKYLRKKKVRILTEAPVVNVTAHSVELKTNEVLATHTLIWAAGVKANSDIEDFGTEKARAGRLVANEYMEAKDLEDVYVIGDLVYYEENGKPTPQIVQAAEQTGHTAATNIVAKIEGGEKHPHESNYQGTLVSVGSTYGVAYLFDKIHLSGFLAILMKHIVNLKYFLDIRSGYYMTQYIFHEFFHIKNKRNIFRGHLSRYGNVLWSVPLRVFYGSMWLVEGLKKAFGILGAESWFGDQVLLPFSWLQDPTSGASEAVEEVAKPIFGLSYAYGEQPMMILEHAPSWFESIMKIMIPNTEMALFFQKFMTCVEIAIALALIFGLFTWLTSAATIGLVLSFTLSGMFYWVNIWFIFVAIALMNGSGRAFGLDYYVIPWIQKKAGTIWYGKSASIHT
ncbi:NAD(P)/FAD-dependent oxidoreductase [Marinilactibacillus sp. XAAS-LB27]|uniref:NAD(P)/FAD-dependent oxidoreductase n=1 Tax=Marinilactibacillus sp. XAAS-LB27 TaxID=3114538 RepID=UPI002E16FD6E|nr:NAD(P)/FAD-dependent oxidoreductase [Marinilactibacillus sp. XAAS-LB27]